MADRALFLSWGENISGREEHGLEVFNESVGFYGRCQEEGRIESFDVVLLPATSDIEGYMVLKGSAEQLAALRDDDEYLRLLTEASTIVSNIRVSEGYCGNGIARVMEIYRDAISKVPQTA
jgi:hypothetical protein